jgi:RNA polymerase sigma-70 factor (ECF subfamily)
MDRPAPAAPPADGDDDRLRELMIRYQRGEIAAFDELYRRTVSMIRGYLGALTRGAARTADLAQDTYLQIHRSRRTYDPRHRVRPWLLAIARHVWLGDRRWHFRHAAREVDGWESLPELPVPPDAERLADRDALSRALGRLAPERREAVVLHHIYGLSFREIGSIVAVSEGGARIRASRGISELRALLARGERHE